MAQLNLQCAQRRPPWPCPDNQADLEEMLLCLDELLALLHFTPHLIHLVLVGLPWYHVLISLQLALHLEGLANKYDGQPSLSACGGRWEGGCCQHLGCPASPRGFSVSSTAAGCCWWAAPERVHTTGPELLCYTRPASPLRPNWPAIWKYLKEMFSYRRWWLYTLNLSNSWTYIFTSISSPLFH